MDKEVAPSTGTSHLQGCMRFKKKKHIKGVKHVLNDDVYLDVVNNMNSMIKYCKKEDEDYQEYGTYIMAQGKKEPHTTPFYPPYPTTHNTQHAHFDTHQHT